MFKSIGIEFLSVNYVFDLYIVCCAFFDVLFLSNGTIHVKNGANWLKRKGEGYNVDH